jgi:hypothetical protein
MNTPHVSGQAREVDAARVGIAKSTLVAGLFSWQNENTKTACTGRKAAMTDDADRNDIFARDAEKLELALNVSDYLGIARLKRGLGLDD